MMWLLATVVFLVVPALEVWLMFSSGMSLVVASLLAAVTAAAGWWAARGENLDLWTELESDVQNRRVPTAEGLDAMMVVLGGWALIIPGLVTDLLGAALLVPPVRRLLMEPVRRVIRTFLI